MNARRFAFTLVELLVVITIIGLLMSLLLPAVQQIREAARRTSCANNLRQLGLATNAYVTTNEFYPPGHTDYGRGEHSWMVLLLPWVEQQAMYDAWQFEIPWNHFDNRQVWERDLPVQLCPSSDEGLPGQGDYAGINGPRPLPSRNGQPALPGGWRKGQAYAAGMMVPTGPSTDMRPIPPAAVRDGLSQTLMIGEAAGRTDGNRFWPDAHQTFAQHGILNISSNNEMFSFHPGGLMICWGDGRAVFLSEATDLTVVDSMSTRDQNEIYQLPE